MSLLLRAFVVCLALFLIVATALPFIPTDEKWIRVFDFPRVQLAVLLLISAAVFLFVMRRKSAFDRMLMAGILLAFGWQAFRILPYTPLSSVQAKASTQLESRSCFRLTVANVLMENRNAEKLISVLGEADPDVVLLVETDAWWDEAMGTLADSFPHSLHQPQDNHYGMVLYSKLPFETASIEFLIDDDIPSVHVQLRLPSEEIVAFYGVHPVPPPLADTTQRDAELLVVGKLAEASPFPAIVAGDMNDVGWSATTRLFQEISGLLDPRHGRGFFASYNAKNPLLRWPLDYVFHDPAFTIGELRLLESFGSDHFPVSIDLCHNPAAEDEQRAPDADAEEEAEASEKIQKGKATEPAPGEYPKEER